MQAELKLQSAGEGQALISLSIPASHAFSVAEAIKNILTFAGHKVRRVNSEGEEVLSAAEVFPDASPAKALRGLRGKEDITQTELAMRLGITQTMVSDMESGRRAISLKMAKRIGDEFKIAYKIFL
jgi:DNA-binding XRE family transcriptional regulator